MAGLVPFSECVSSLTIESKVTSTFEYHHSSLCFIIVSRPIRFAILTDFVKKHCGSMTSQEVRHMNVGHRFL